MAGLLGSMLAGAAQGLGSGLEKVGKQWGEAAHQDFLNEAQAVRAKSLAELQGKIQTTLEKDVRQPFSTSERVADEAAKTAERRASETFTSGENAADRALRERQLGVQEKQVNAVIQQINLAARKGTIEVEQAERSNDLHKAYLASTDPTEKASLADDIYTIAGKDKFTPLIGKDDVGNPIFMGAFNTRSGQRETGGGGAAADPLGLRGSLGGNAPRPEGGQPQATPQPPEAPRGIINSGKETLLTPEDERTIRSQPSPAARTQKRNELLRQRMAEKSQAERAAELPLAEAEEARLRSRGIDPGSAAFRR